MVFILRLSNFSTVWTFAQSPDAVSDCRQWSVQFSFTVCRRVVAILLVTWLGFRGWCVTKSFCNLSLILLSAFSVACSQELPVAKTQTASQGTEGTSGTTPSPGLGSGNNGNTGGGVASPIYAHGQVYGSCLVKYDDQFRATYADPQPTFPVLTCSTVGEPT